MKSGLVLLFASFVAVNCLDVANYLQRFGYYNPNSYDQSNLENALRTFQRTYNLPVTGKLDEPTKKLMNTPRCGNPDHNTNNAFSDKAWRKKTLSYYFYNYSPSGKLSKSDIRRITLQAFGFWTEHTPLQFYEKQGGDIVFGFGSRSHSDDKKGRCYSSFDGRGRVLAHAYFPPDGRLHYDDDENWTDRSYQGSNFLSTAVHEIGHILGLEHDSSSKTSIMYPYDQGYQQNLKLNDNDIRRIQLLYGKKNGGTVPTNRPPPATQPPPSYCQDLHTNCRDFKHNCDKSTWLSHMKKYCKRTCNYCN